MLCTLPMRLKSGLVADSLLRRATGLGLGAYMAARGDEDRGGIVLKLVGAGYRTRLLERTTDMDGRTVWRPIGPADGAAETDMDDRLRRRRAVDGDMWVLEIEDPKGVYPLDDPVEDAL